MNESEFAKPWAVVATFTSAGCFIGMDIALWPAAEDWSRLPGLLIGGLIAGAVAGGLLAWLVSYLEYRSVKSADLTRARDRKRSLQQMLEDL
jgi:hypothetical protein